MFGQDVSGVLDALSPVLHSTDSQKASVHLPVTEGSPLDSYLKSKEKSGVIQSVALLFEVTECQMRKFDTT